MSKFILKNILPTFISIIRSNNIHTTFQKYCESNIKSKLLCERQCEEPLNYRKVSIIGAAGNVGIGVTANLMISNACDEIVLFDVKAKKNFLQAELLDYFPTSSNLTTPKLKICTNYKNTANSTILIITAGVLLKKGQTRLDFVGENAKILQQIIPKVSKLSPESVIIVISNPVEIMTWMTWKLSGFYYGRVIGTGTELDTARFRSIIGKKLGIHPSSVHGYIVGEHGESCVPLWSSVNVAGTKLIDLDTNFGLSTDPDNWYNIHKQVIQSGYEILNLKGYTSWGVAGITLDIVRSVLQDSNKIHCVSTYCKGIHDIKTDCFLSLPCVIGNRGVRYLVQQCITEQEHDMLIKSANVLDKVMKKIKI